MPRTLPPPSVPDTELVRRFVTGRDEAAFELLVWRYRGLVTDVCRRVLGHTHDAEDAAQAAFLVLARKAGRLRGDSLAPWLARVAHLCAMRVRRSRKPFAALPDVPVPTSLPDPLDTYLDAELDRLPEKYRRPIVLCYLHGLSYAEASEQLRCPTGTLCGWLTRGKALLRKRLARRGVTVPAGVFAAYLGGLGVASSSHHHIRNLTSVSVAFAAGYEPAGPPAAIAHGVLNMMGLKRGSLLAVWGLLAVTLGAAALFAADPKKPDEPKQAVVKPEKASDIDRTIGKEPKYQGKPVYCLLAFDPEAKQRVWLVHDGDTLYVDRNGNGDLTDDGEKFTSQKPKDDDYWSNHFKAGDVTTGGATHKGLSVTAGRLDRATADSFLTTIAPIEPALKKDKTALAYTVQVESARPGVKGSAADGRVPYRAGPFDANGVLQFAGTTTDAPVIHLGGRLELWSQFGERVLHPGQDEGFRMVLGAPGFGPGTQAQIPYDNNIPDDAHPVAEITFPAKPGEKPRTQVVPVNMRTCGYSLDARFKCGDETGSATVKFSFDAWKAGNVATTTHSVAIQPPPALTGPKAEPVSGAFVTTLPHPGMGSLPRVQYTSDGKRLIATGDLYSGVVQLWDVDGRKELLQIAGPRINKADRSQDTFLAEGYAPLSPDGKTLYLPTRGEKSTRVERDGKKADWFDMLGRIRRWDLTTKKELEPFVPPDGWGNLEADLSPDGRYLYSVEVKSRLRDDISQDRLVVWDTATGKRVTLGNGRMGAPPKFLPDGKRVATASVADGKFTVVVYSLPDGKELIRKTHPGEADWSATFADVSIDGTLAFNLGGKKDKPTTTVFLDPDTLEETARWTGPAKPIGFGHTSGLFTPDGKRFLVIDGDHTLNVWDVAAKKVVRTVKLEGTPYRLLTSPDGRWFATHWIPPDPNKMANEVKPDPSTMPQPRAILVDLNDPESKPVTLVAPRGRVWSIAFRPDGKQLALGGSGGVHLFDLTK